MSELPQGQSGRTEMTLRWSGLNGAILREGGHCQTNSAALTHTQS